MEFKLSSNVLEEILKYANDNYEKPCPTFFLKVKDVEKKRDRYWLTLEEESGKEIWAMFSLLLSRKILIQQLINKPIIKLKHYYLHTFEAANFVDNPIAPHINVIGISDIQILEGKALRKEIEIQNNMGKSQMLPRRKKKKRMPEPELESSDEDFQPTEKEGKEIIQKSPEPKTKLNSVVTVKEVVQPLENKNQNRNQPLTDEINNTYKIKSIVQSSGNKISDEINNTSKSQNVVQPSENKSPNIQPTYNIPESFVGNGKTATLISSLTLTRNSPSIRACVKICGAITVSVRGCTYRRCRLKDSSGEISCVIFEPICTSINNFLKAGAIIEIENAIVDEIPTTMLAGNEKYKINLRQSTIVALYNDNTCVYENPPKSSPVILPIINNSKVKYPLLQSIKNSIRSADRADAIGVLVWMSQIFDVNHNNRRVKCRNLRIQDESGSVLVATWENIAENVYFPIGSVVSVKCARMKMIHGDLELVIDYRARISLAEDCEEKTRLLKWYQPAARRMIPKI